MKRNSQHQLSLILQCRRDTRNTVDEPEIECLQNLAQMPFRAVEAEKFVHSRKSNVGMADCKNIQQRC